MCDISIIIPVYNTSIYLEDAIKSIYNQNFSGVSFELIAIDDCSTDNSYSVLSELSNKYGFYVVKNEENKGVSCTRNIGLNMAVGIYVYFLDSDDFVSNQFFEVLSNNLELDIDMISFGFRMQKLENSLLFKNDRFNNCTFSNGSFLIEYFKRNIMQCMCSFICKRTIIVENGLLFDESTYYGEDQEFQMKCMIFSKKILYLSNPLFQYRYNQNSTMNYSFSIKRLTTIDAFLRLNILCKDESYYKHFVNYFFYNYYSLLKIMLKSNVNDDLLNTSGSDRFNDLHLLVPYIKWNKIGIIVNVLFYTKKLSKNLFNKILKSIR